MPTKPVQKITSWSFSRYSDYVQCPLKAKLKHIDKIREPQNDAMARGAEIHKIAENYIKGITARLPKELKLFKDEFKELKAMCKKDPDSIMVEDSWAFKSDWTKTVWNDWVGCWLRVKLDCAHQEDSKVLIITDWKTGKFSDYNLEDYVEQLELYALGALLLFPQLEEVRPRLAYLDHGIIYPDPGQPLVFKRKDVVGLRKLWERRTKAMLNDKIFAPKPNNKCKWCFFRKANAAAGGGQCKF